MINAIAELGKFYLSQNPSMGLLEMVLDDAWDKGKNMHLLTVVFTPVGEPADTTEKWLPKEWAFKNVEYFELGQQHKMQLLYKKGAPNGADFTPTTKIVDLEKKTFDKKIIRWFEQNKENPVLSQSEQKMITGLFEEIKINREKIIQQTLEKINIINDSSGQALTIGFEMTPGKIEFLNHFDLFQKFLTEEAVADFKYSKTNKAYSFSADTLCSVCNNRQPEVFGFFTDLKFYNVDKQGMITGGFQYEDAWKNYPVCLDCALNVRNGYDYLRTHFDFLFYGLHYLFIPRVSNPRIYDDIITVLTNYRHQTFKTEHVNLITNDEQELFSYIKDEKASLSFDLFFYEMPQKSVLRILLLVQDVLPSRISQLFKIKKYLDQIVFFRSARNKENERLCFFNFGVLRNFFPNSNMEGNFDKHFLELTNKIFKNKPIDLLFVRQKVMSKIQKRFVNDESFWLDTLKGFMLLLFLNQLKNKEIEMDSAFFQDFQIQTRDEMEMKVRKFFEHFKNFFETPAHQAIFLLGVLSQFLLSIQKQERNATPFRTKLKGLKMTAFDLSVLLPEIIEKLEQYDKNYYRPQEELVSKLLLEAGNYKTWRLPIDEMNFVFVLGMNLSNYFKV
ncbi:TIGR02556 family CRISPR-associated protein, partial [candidate division KSB1 bacterium]|nr:TIGR02556 family CRISPR-associated protein [candidate division KSB1 bacterium]